MRTVIILLAFAASTLLAAGVPPVSAAAPMPTRAAADACGTLVPKAGGGYWACSLAENFSGSSLNRSLWLPMTNPSWGADQCLADSPATVRVGNGMLTLQAVRSGAGVTCPVRSDGTRAPYASGWVTSYYRWSQQYGRFEIRMRNTASDEAGLHEAFWLWPDTRYSTDTTWPASGEIDVVETFSAFPINAVPFLHYNLDDNGGAIPQLNTAFDCWAQRGEWHTYTLEWTSSQLAIDVDGKRCLTNTDGAPTFRKRFIMNIAQLIGVGVNAPTPQTLVPATTLVDYVKVWR